MAMFLRDGRAEESCIDAVGVVGGMGQDVNATVDCDLNAGEVGGMGEDKPAVEMALGHRSFGDVDGHGKNMSALDPGAGEELGEVGASGKVAADDAGCLLGCLGLGQHHHHPARHGFAKIEGRTVGRVEGRSRRVDVGAGQFALSQCDAGWRRCRRDSSRDR